MNSSNNTHISRATQIFKKIAKPLVVVLALTALINPTFLQTDTLATAKFKSETLSLVSVVEVPRTGTYSIYLSPDEFESSFLHKDWIFKDESIKSRVILLPYDRSKKRIESTYVSLSPNTALGAVSGLRAVSNLEVPAGKYKLYLTTKASSAPPVPTTVHLKIQPESGLFLKLQTLVQMMGGLLSIFLGIVISSMLTSKLRDLIGFE